MTRPINKKARPSGREEPGRPQNEKYMKKYSNLRPLEQMGRPKSPRAGPGKDKKSMKLLIKIPYHKRRYLVKSKGGIKR